MCLRTLQKSKTTRFKRAQDVNNFQRQAAGQLTELQRQDQVLSANDHLNKTVRSI